MDNFWILEAPKNTQPTAIPGTSKWIASEMAEFSSMVCSQAKTFEDSVTSNMQWLNDQVNEIIYFDDDIENTSGNKLTLLLRSPKKSPVKLPEQTHTLAKQKFASPEKIGGLVFDSPVKLNTNMARINQAKEQPVQIAEASLQPVYLDFNKKPTLTSLNSNKNTEDMVSQNEEAPHSSGRKKKSSIAINPLYLSSPMDGKLFPGTMQNNIVNVEDDVYLDSPIKQARHPNRKSLNSKPNSNMFDNIECEKENLDNGSERKSKLFAPLPSRTPLTVKRNGVISSTTIANSTNNKPLTISSAGITKKNTLKRKITKIREEKSPARITKKPSPQKYNSTKLVNNPKTNLSKNPPAEDVKKSPVPSNGKVVGLGVTAALLNDSNKSPQSINDPSSVSPGFGHYFSNAISRAKSIFKHAKLDNGGETASVHSKGSAKSTDSNDRLKRSVSPIKLTTSSTTTVSSASTKHSAASSATTVTSGPNSLVSRLMAPTESSAAKSFKKKGAAKSVSPPKRVHKTENDNKSPVKEKTGKFAVPLSQIPTAKTKLPPTIRAPTSSITTAVGLGKKSKGLLGLDPSPLYPRLPKLSPTKALAKNLIDNTSTSPKDPQKSPITEKMDSNTNEANSRVEPQDKPHPEAQDKEQIEAQNKPVAVNKRKLEEDNSNDKADESNGNRKNSINSQTSKKRKSNSRELKKIDLNSFKTPIAEKLKQESTLTSMKRNSNLTRLSLPDEDERMFLQRPSNSGNINAASLTKKKNILTSNVQKTPNKNSLFSSNISSHEISITSTPNQNKFNGSQLMKSTIIKNAATMSTSSDLNTSFNAHLGNTNHERINPPIMLTPNSSLIDTSYSSKLQKYSQQQHHRQLQSKSKPQPKTVLPEIHSDSSDDEDPSVLKSWANSPELKNLLKNQQKVDPDHLFGPIGKLDLSEIFTNYQQRSTKSFVSRSSSARWDDNDKLTRQEIEQYKLEMGFKK